MIAANADEVERRVVAFEDELKPAGEVDRALVRRAAALSVRMERCVDREAASLSARVRLAMEEFEAPEGLDPAEADHLRHEAGRRRRRPRLYLHILVQTRRNELAGENSDQEWIFASMHATVVSWHEN